jgi:beta-barrel assembly-enhancing protease
MSKSRLCWRNVLGGGALAVLCAGLALAQTWWPPKPPRGYNIFNEQQEYWLGEILADEQKLGDHVIQDAEATTYLEKIGNRLVQQSKAPTLRFQFFLFESKEPNAFALPGGRVYVNRGMFAFCSDEAELAAVVAHEIGHCVLRQGAKTFSRWLAWGPGVSKVGDREDVQNKIRQLEAHLESTGRFQQAADLLFGVARTDELWADKYGIWDMYATGYDPKAAIAVFQRIATLQRENRIDDPWLRLLDTLFSSHPATKERIELLRLELPWMRPKADATLDTEAFRAVKSRFVPKTP